MESKDCKSPFLNRVKRTVSHSPREEDRFFVYYHIFTVYLCEGVPSILRDRGFSDKKIS